MRNGGHNTDTRSSDAISKVMLAGRLIHPDVFARDYREAIGEATDEEIEELRLEILAALREHSGSRAAPS